MSPAVNTPDQAPLLAIVGQTATGKSALAMELARRLPCEIICADSRTVYRGLDIGAAKPDAQDRARVPHHLLDVLDLSQFMGADEFRARADGALADIRARGALALLVGGTKAFIEAVLFDVQREALSDAQRARLSAMGTAQLRAELMRADVSLPLADRDRERLLTALERNRAAGYRPRADGLKMRVLALSPVPEAALHEMVWTRLQRMLSAGLEEEVRSLTAAHGRSPGSINSIGYSEWEAYFEGHASFLETVDTIVEKTLWYARLQALWLERLAQLTPVIWLSAPASAAQMADEALSALAAGGVELGASRRNLAA